MRDDTVGSKQLQSDQSLGPVGMLPVQVGTRDSKAKREESFGNQTPNESFDGLEHQAENRPNNTVAYLYNFTY